MEKNPSLHVVSIGLNRPEKRNCVNEETAAALAEAFLDFEQDEEMRCAVLHGFGGNFCAGYDLEELSRLTDEERPNRLASMLERGPMVRGVSDVIKRKAQNIIFVFVLHFILPYKKVTSL